ncbi:MAG: chemotaxis protein CheD [Pseudomonadota bacterium]
MPKDNRKTDRVYIAQGEQAIGDLPDMIISTILGSCVSVCLWDPDLRIGGMNHILVPEGAVSDARALSFGANAMETLINALMKSGANRAGLVAKVFGGASIVTGLSDIGERNAAFAFEYLRIEGIPCHSSSVGGTQARQIRFWPENGRVRQRFVREAEAPSVQLNVPLSSNEMELL